MVFSMLAYLHLPTVTLATALLSRATTSRYQAAAALSSAAVPRVGLGPTTPPLCRCAERTTDLILQAPRAIPSPFIIPAPPVIPAKAGIQSCRTPTLFAAPALGVSGVAASRKEAVGRGDSRVATHPKCRGVHRPKRNCVLNFETFSPNAIDNTNRQP
jgi:hypothetical protein